MVGREGKGGNRKMMRLKSCPKCKGDVMIDRDHYGWYEQCIQCGHISDLPDAFAPPEETYIPVKYEREKHR